MKKIPRGAILASDLRIGDKFQSMSFGRVRTVVEIIPFNSNLLEIKYIVEEFGEKVRTFQCPANELFRTLQVKVIYG